MAAATLPAVAHRDVRHPAKVGFAAAHAAKDPLIEWGGRWMYGQRHGLRTSMKATSASTSSGERSKLGIVGAKESTISAPGSVIERAR